MHKTITYMSTTWLPPPPPANSAPGGSPPPPPPDNKPAGPGPGTIKRDAKKLVSENAVIVFGRKGCFMCHVLRLLLLGLGVNPLIVEVEEAEEAAVIHELSYNLPPTAVAVAAVGGGLVQFPAVFLGGRLFGGLERVVATHISGELVPLLRQVGALWL